MAMDPIIGTPNGVIVKQHCTLTHAYDPPENAVNIEEWQKIKLLPRNFNSGGGKSMILKGIKKEKVD